MEGLYILRYPNLITGGYARTFVVGEENAREFYFDAVNDGEEIELYDTKVDEFGVVEENIKLLG